MLDEVLFHFGALTLIFEHFFFVSLCQLNPLIGNLLSVVFPLAEVLLHLLFLMLEHLIFQILVVLFVDFVLRIRYGNT